MSDRITWQPCPLCGGSAAVGWAARPDTRQDGQETVLEFDCVNNCTLTEAQLEALRQQRS